MFDDKINNIKKNLNIISLVNYLRIEIHKGNFIKSIYKEEREASLKIYPETNSYYCFSSSKGGDVIKFYKDYKNIDIKTAINELKNICNIDNYNKNNKENMMLNNKINKSSSIEIEERLSIIMYSQNKVLNEIEAKDIYIENEAKAVFNELYSYCIKQGIDDKVYKYLTKERKLKDSIIKQYKLFSINDYKGTNEHIRNKFNKDILKLIGLYNEKGNLIFYKHKIIIPFIGKNDEINYIRGRYFEEITKDKKCESKYLGIKNLTSKRYYNEIILDELDNNDKIYVCEGEFDTLIMIQECYKAIGILGVGNINENMLSKLLEYKIVLCLDNDEAGKKAIERIGKYYEERNKVIQIKKIIENKDINEYYKENKINE